MIEIGRIALAFLAAIAALAGTIWLAGPSLPDTLKFLAALAMAAIAGGIVWRAGNSVSPLVKGALLGAAWGGIIGFVGGFFGPMLFAPDANQGPMLGLFITGPGGVVAGALCGIAIAAGKPG